MMKAFLICCFFGLYAYSFHGVQGCSGSSSTTKTYYIWDTKFGDYFNMVCESGESLYNLRSVHNDQKKDRMWGYYCRKNSYITTSCDWSLPSGQYVNSYDGTVNFICPREGYMVGMHGNTHDSYYGDRRFDFKCCDAKPGLGQTECKWTDYVNTWDARMDYSAPSGYFIAGAYSVHSDSYEDRRWKFYICK